MVGKKPEAGEMTVSWSAFTTPSLAEFGLIAWSVGTEAASLSWTDGLCMGLHAGSSGQQWAEFGSSKSQDVTKEDSFPTDLGKEISLLGGTEAPSPQWHLQGLCWKGRRRSRSLGSNCLGTLHPSELSHGTSLKKICS